MNSLHTQSVYSFNGSVLTLEQLVKSVQSKSPFVALADRGMHSALRFLALAKSHQLQPLLGIEVEMEGPLQKVPALIYARGEKGYQACLELSSLYAFKSVLSNADCEPYQDNITLLFFTDSAEENDFKEHYQSLKHIVFNPSDLNLQKVTRLNDSFKDVDEVMDQLLSSKILESQGLEETFKSSLAMDQFAKEHVLAFTFQEASLPVYPSPDDLSSNQYLRALAKKGLERRLQMTNQKPKGYFERLEKELNVIHELGYDDYFLIVWDIVKEAKRLNLLVGPGRGSAPGSLVAYALGITHVDPLVHDLLFERFLNAARKTMPDIDMDFPDEDREKILFYLKEKYGPEHVALIATFGTFLKKSALRDSARILKVEDKYLKDVLKEIEDYDTVEAMVTSSATVKDRMGRFDLVDRWLTIAIQLEGLPRHISTHAAGVLLSDRPLTTYTALSPGLYGLAQTDLEQKDCERLNLLKIDILGLRNLTLIQRITNLIESKKPINLYALNLQDSKTFQGFQTGQTDGIFQLESPGMRRLIKRLKPDRFDDIVALLALYRPGPMESIDTYLKRRQKKEIIPVIHPAIDRILAPTEGILIYQEQIMAIATDFAGYTLQEADLLRRAVSKKDRAILEEERSRFVKKAVALKNPDALAEEIYDFIVRFADYGFNRSHSVAYAMVAYWMMYLKTHSPREFLAVMMEQALHQEKAMMQYIEEAERLNITIEGPSLNHSDLYFKKDTNALYYPLSGIKNIGKESAKKVIEVRPEKGFSTFMDFIKLTKPFLNVRQWRAFIDAGACDDFGFTHQTMIENVEAIRTFLDFTEDDVNQFKIEVFEEYSYDYLELKEKEALSINLSYSLFAPYQNHLAHPDVSTLDDWLKNTKTKVFLARLENVREITTKTGEKMAFLTLQGKTISIEAVLFPEGFQKVPVLEPKIMYQFIGQNQERNQKAQINISQMKPIPSL